jgi:hypothetical protein
VPHVAHAACKRANRVCLQPVGLGAAVSSVCSALRVCRLFVQQRYICESHAMTFLQVALTVLLCAVALGGALAFGHVTCTCVPPTLSGGARSMRQLHCQLRVQHALCLWLRRAAGTCSCSAAMHKLLRALASRVAAQLVARTGARVAHSCARIKLCLQRLCARGCIQYRVVHRI